jgi:hypothetical protein
LHNLVPNCADPCDLTALWKSIPYKKHTWIISFLLLAFIPVCFPEAVNWSTVSN